MADAGQGAAGDRVFDVGHPGVPVSALAAALIAVDRTLTAGAHDPTLLDGPAFQTVIDATLAAEAE